MPKVLPTYDTALVKCTSSQVQHSQMHKYNFITKEKYIYTHIQNRTLTCVQIFASWFVH